MSNEHNDKVFDIPTSHRDLLTWFCHSICVMAMNLLHRTRFSNSCIKNRLRWRSDTFMMYLRNTFYTADQHTKVIILGLNPPPRGMPGLLNRMNCCSMPTQPNMLQRSSLHTPQTPHRVSRTDTLKQLHQLCILNTLYCHTCLGYHNLLTTHQFITPHAVISHTRQHFTSRLLRYNRSYAFCPCTYPDPDIRGSNSRPPHWSRNLLDG